MRLDLRLFAAALQARQRRLVARRGLRALVRHGRRRQPLGSQMLPTASLSRLKCSHMNNYARILNGSIRLVAER